MSVKHLHRPVMLILTLFAALCATGGAMASGMDIYSGAFSMDDLRWTRNADGTARPVLPDTRPMPQDGLPLLPAKSMNLLIPAGFDVGGVEIVPVRLREIPLKDRLQQGTKMISSENVAVGQAIYPAGESVYPESWSPVWGTSYLRGFKLLSVNVFPMRAHRDEQGAWTRLEFLEEYTVRILPSSGIDGQRPAVRERRVPGERQRTEKMVAGIVENPFALSGYDRYDGLEVDAQDVGFSPDKAPSLSGSAVSYLIITNEALQNAFQPLADHRTATGYPAVVRTIEWIAANHRNGADIQETMRLFIRDAYEKWGVEYVLLGGDTDILPARYARNLFYPPSVGSDIPVDMYFACLDGNWNADGDNLFGETGTSIYEPGDDCDMAREIMIGRIPVSTPEQVSDFISKLTKYETTSAGEEFADNFLFAAEELFHDDQGNVTIDGAGFAESLVDNILLPYSSMDYVRMYEAWDDTLTNGTLKYPGAVPESRAAVIDSLNTGNYHVFNQIGHGYFYNMSLGDENLTVADAASLVNSNPFLLYALNCASAAFDYACLMERFVKNPDGGSFASIGASRAAFPFNAADFQEEFFEQLYRYEVQQLGDLINLSALPWVAQSYAPGFERWTLMNYTLLGDPATPVWLNSPEPVEVAAPSSVGFGDQVLTITVTSDAVPVDGASVTVRMGDSVFAMDATDASGVAELPLALTGAGRLTVTVSGVNLELTTDTIDVVAPSFYAALDSLKVVDDGTQGSSGNGNGLPEAGETVALRGYYRDTGGAGGSDLISTLSVSTSGVTIIDAIATLGSLPAGGTAAASEYFLVELDDAIMDGTKMMFRVDVTDLGAGDWPTDITLIALAPEIEAVSLAWEDETYGDNGHDLDEGERIVLQAGLKNFGVGTANLVTARLRTNTPANVTIYDSLATYTALGLLDVSIGSADFSLAVVDTSLPFDMRLDFIDDFGRVVTHDFTPTVPDAPASLEVDNTRGPDLLAVSWTPVDSEAVRGYHVYRSQESSGTYERVNTDLIEQVSYYRDEGLDMLTTYYYKVSTVDSTLCESDLSLPVHMSTAPPELGDFPLAFGSETSSHNAVADVDGDHRLDVVICADEIYVWHEDGTELFDGDNDAQTLGPITDFGGGFSPMAPALADLDGVAGCEIVTSNWNDYKVHIFKADGTELPGWPQSTSGARVWMAPAIGDIDGDGELEIVVNNLGGKTLAWNIDGTEVANGDGNTSTNGPLIVRDYEWGFSSPALFDVDNDGQDEIIFGNTYGTSKENFLHAYNWDGTEAPGFPYSVGMNSIGCSPAIADLDGDEIWEIIVVAENDSLHVVQQDGTRYPGFPIHFTANSLSSGGVCPSPAVGDFDEDGMLEIVAIEVFGAADSYVHVIDTDWAGGTSGQTLPEWPKYVPGNSEGSPLVGDLDGDGMLDVLWGVGGSSAQVADKLYAFTHNANDVPGFPLTLGGPVRPTPVICDLDDDHDVDIVYGGWDLSVHVWDMPFPSDGRKQPWGTFQGSNLRDGVHRRVSTTGVEETAPPLSFRLMPVYPNPFNPTTTIRMYVPGEAGETMPLRVMVHDLKGRVVQSIFDGRAQPGWQTWNWDGRNRNGRPQASGVYFLRASSGAWSDIRKMSLVK